MKLNGTGSKSLDKTYCYSILQEGYCKVCRTRQLLSMGCCFDCSIHVDGREVEGGYELWDIDNLSNRWMIWTN